MTEDPKSKIENRKFTDLALAGHLQELTRIANEIGAQGIWLIRGATRARLIYEPAGEEIELPDIPGAQVSGSLDININLADAGVLVVMRFPASDGGEPGIESRQAPLSS